MKISFKQRWGIFRGKKLWLYIRPPSPHVESDWKTPTDAIAITFIKGKWDLWFLVFGFTAKATANLQLQRKANEALTMTRGKVRERMVLSDLEIAFLKAKGPVFSKMWKKKIERGLTTDQREEWDMMVAVWRVQQQGEMKAIVEKL